jgi:hypothetical protein
MGVGLSISRTIIEAHGGRIWVESNPGGGAVSASPCRREQPEETDRCRMTARLVHIIDDDDAMRDSLSFLLGNRRSQSRAPPMSPSATDFLKARAADASMRAASSPTSACPR